MFAQSALPVLGAGSRPDFPIWVARLFSVAAHPLCDGAHGNARWSLGDPWLLFLDPGHAGDIQMDPRCLVYKLLEEHGRGDGSTPAAATRVHDVGDAGLDHLFVVVFDR